MLYPNGEFSLGLSMPVKSHKPPESSSSRERSGKPQTSYSKRMVRNCVAKLERTHGRHNLAFATYTLPEMPEERLQTVVDGVPEICRQLIQAIERYQQRAGIKPEVVYCIEIQEERYNKTGLVVPHIHVVFQSRKTRYHSYAISKELNTELWNRAVSNVLGERIEIPYGAKIEVVRKSAERYMSKYMSKGGKLAQKVKDDNKTHLLPKAWWGATLTLRKWVKDNTKILSESAQEFIRENYKQCQADIKNSPFSWLYVHAIELLQPHGEMTETPIAIVGKVRPSWMPAFECRDIEFSFD